MLNNIETGKSDPEKIRKEAREEAENWFRRRLAEAKVLGEYGKATGKKMEEVIRGHLLGDYIGDIYNPVVAAHLFFQSTSEAQREAGGKDLVEKERLSFLFRLETVNRAEVASWIPEEAKVKLRQLAEQVRRQKWLTLEDIQKLFEKKKRITVFVREKWGRDLRAAHNQLQEAEKFNTAHGLLTVKDYFQV